MSRSQCHAIANDLAIAQATTDAYRACLQALDGLRARTALVTDAFAIGIVRADLESSLHHYGQRLRKLEHQRSRLYAVLGAGQRPAVEGHGCPALSPAVGPAPSSTPSADITAHDNPLFFASMTKELPDSDFCADNRPVLAGENVL